MNLIIKLNWEDDGRNNLTISRFFILILFFFFFINEIDFLFHFLDQSFILNYIIFSLRAVPPKMISKSLATAKVSFILDQEHSVIVRKRFKFRRLSRDSCEALFLIIETSGMRGLIRRKIMMRIEYWGSGMIVIRDHENRVIITRDRGSRVIVIRQ